MRFAHGVSDAFIEDYATRMTDMGSLVYAYIEDGEVRAAAELRKLSETWGQEAEAAFSVEQSRQGKGLGSMLMGRVIRSARNRGVQRLYMSCLPENAKMQAIARKYEADLKLEYGEVVGEIVPVGPNYFSILAEAVDDRVGYMLAVLDLQEPAGPRRLTGDTSRPQRERQPRPALDSIDQRTATCDKKVRHVWWEDCRVALVSVCAQATIAAVVMSSISFGPLAQPAGELELLQAAWCWWRMARSNLSRWISPSGPGPNQGRLRAQKCNGKQHKTARSRSRYRTSIQSRFQTIRRYSHGRPNAISSMRT